jgi:signal transduction histidine kinase
LYNITKRKKAEEEVWQALTRQLQLNELKSKFVSIASHEFRTPLSGILSSAYLISKYSELNDTENLQKHADRISGAVRTLTDILNDFLSLGKMDEGKVRNNCTTFSVTGFCHQLVEDLQPNLKKEQQLIYEHKSVNETVSLDKEHLRHVLSNLISNAVKYSSEGKTIWLHSATKNGHITFSVKDEGIGIPAEAQPHLFQTFFRADNAANYQGTGMGLHIVKRFLDIMGGSIRFSSKLNQGTSFTVRFPVPGATNESSIITDGN